MCEIGMPDQADLYQSESVMEVNDATYSHAYNNERKLWWQIMDVDLTWTNTLFITLITLR